MGKTLIYLVQQLLHNNKISFDKDELSFQIQSHPSFPSLHAITGVLDHFNIENIAAEVPIDTETLLLLPNCFIAQVKDNLETKLVIVNKVSVGYQINTSSKEKEKLSNVDFLKIFTGIVVAAEKSEDENSNPSVPKNNFKSIVLGITAFLFVILLILNKPSFIAICYLLLSIIGVLLSVSILKQEQGIETILGNAFCSGNDEKKDCDAVLSSKGAKIIGDYKLSDFSLLYFSGLCIATAFSILFQLNILPIVFLISLFALPITLYSIYYQFAVVKKWCLLCLSIVGVLWLQASIVFMNGVYFTQLEDINGYIIVAFSFMVFFAVWSSLKPIITNFTILKKNKIESVKFKRNYALFESLLNKSEVLNTTIPDIEEIVFGNINSNLEIVIITNPFCGHCKPVHKLVDVILNKYRDLVKITIRFAVNIKNLDGDDVKITSRILEIYATEGKEKCLQAMDAIYGNMSSDFWLDKWKCCKEPKKYITILEKENFWNNDNGINFTPEILVNGRSFPKEYDRHDLLFFIEELQESYAEMQLTN